MNPSTLNDNEVIKKKGNLRSLVKKRRENVPLGYKGIADFQDGIYETSCVTPYTKTAGNLNSEIFFILQDWASEETLCGTFNDKLATLGYDPQLPTNKSLSKLIKQHFDMEIKDTYITNLFPFIKSGRMSSTIPAHLLRMSAVEYAIPQIEIVNPKLVVCFGLSVSNAIRNAHNLSPYRKLSQAINYPYRVKNILFFTQSHPGALGRANRNRGGIDNVSGDWGRMIEVFKSHRC